MPQARCQARCSSAPVRFSVLGTLRDYDVVPAIDRVSWICAVATRIAKYTARLFPQRPWLVRPEPTATARLPDRRRRWLRVKRGWANPRARKIVTRREDSMANKIHEDCDGSCRCRDRVVGDLPAGGGREAAGEHPPSRLPRQGLCLLAGQGLGGTLGQPLEGQHGPHEVPLTTKLSQGIANDEADLEILWLAALEEHDAQADCAGWASTGCGT